ncbi:uncharacterized protein LOC130966795 [Arachis stenosperma]|uniref:uncharacterized protein LOC130966795 n=1 Tax=Arachis stenosperma TaxID=217475 RepID=UPI0025AB8FB1|nr:uncharacterized protein LOC130966795 [Arachis stenosperma]
MEEIYDFFANVKAKKQAWNFKAYIVRKWKVPSKFNQKEIFSIEMVLQDSKGSRMHASVPTAIVKKWSHVITEFQMYTMSNFVVLHSKNKKTSHFKWILIFTYRTVVNHVQNPSFPLVAWHLKSIAELLTAEKVDDSELFGTTSMQSHFYVSKLHFDPEIKEVAVFRSRMLCGAPFSSPRISQVSSQGRWSGVEDLNQGSVVAKTIEEVLNSSETYTNVNKLPMEGPVWIIATVVSINASKSDWYYKSCRRCPKKIDIPIGERYECTKCGRTHGCAAIKYKLEVMVCDGTGSMTLLLWDRETTQLAGKIAEKIVDEEVGNEEYPPTLDNIMDKKALFKINVKMANIKQYDQVYTVSKVCDDEELVEKNMPKKMQTNPSTNITKNGYSNSVDMSGHVVNLETDTDPHFSMDGLEDSVSSGKCKTPAKSASSGINDAVKSLPQHEEEGQFFTNRFSRRVGKKQKIQLIDEES